MMNDNYCTVCGIRAGYLVHNDTDNGVCESCVKELFKNMRPNNDWMIKKIEAINELVYPDESWGEDEVDRWVEGGREMKEKILFIFRGENG